MRLTAASHCLEILLQAVGLGNNRNSVSILTGLTTGGSDNITDEVRDAVRVDRIDDRQTEKL